MPKLPVDQDEEPGSFASNGTIRKVSLCARFQRSSAGGTRIVKLTRIIFPRECL